MTRLRYLDCQDGRHCHHTGYVPAGMILAACRYLGCNPQPIQALVENDLGGCADCGQPASKLLVGGAGQRDISLCEACEYPPVPGRGRRPRPRQRGSRPLGPATDPTP